MRIWQAKDNAPACCPPKETAKPASPQLEIATSCCDTAPAAAAQPRRRVDYMLWGSAVLVALGYGAHLLFGAADDHSQLAHFASGTYELMNAMWWGIVLGIVFVGLLDRVPREIVISALSGNRRMTGILRATAAGVLFDLCSHGILMVGMKLYERGASIGQTIAFLLASPWNSLSLTVILIALIGWWYTIAFVLLSAVIAIATGWLFDVLVERGRLPDNPARLAGVQNGSTNLRQALRVWFSNLQPSWRGGVEMLRDGLHGSRMVLRWLLFGVVLAAAIRALLPPEAFADWFGPTLFGVMMTVIAATIIEVCSEGSAPIAADLVTRASAPGNGFTFLMAGVATDYTEIMSLKDTTGSWKLALMLPVLAVPQTLVVAVLLNALA
ncbi:MAG: permease [Hyphomicrobiaceae bacterium]